MPVVNPLTTVEEAYGTILRSIIPPGEEPWEGIVETPGRAARAWAEMTSGYQTHIGSLFKTFERGDYDEMIVVRDIPFASLCEHHLLPFHGEAHIGYVPSDRVVGISKLGRVVDAYAKRLQIQERMTVEIATAIEENLKPKGVVVMLSAEHLCMSIRGIRKPGARTVTSVVRGVMFDKPEARAEAIALIG